MTSLRPLLVRNLTIQTISEAVGLACGLATSMLLARYLDFAGFGAFNYAFAFMYFFLALNDLGINSIAIREVAQQPSRAGAILGAALSLRLAIAAVVLVAAWITIAWWPMEPSLRTPLMLFALILPLNALNVPGVIFQTAMRFEFGAAVNITVRLLGLVLLVPVILSGYGVTAVLATLLLADAAGAAVLWILSRRLVRIEWSADPLLWRPLLSSALPLGASMLLVAVVNRVDFIMLERLASLEDVGLYGAAYRVTNMLEKFPLFVMGTLYPVMARLAIDDVPRLRHTYLRALGFFAVIALPLGFAAGAAGPWFMATVFSEPYRAAGPALQYLVWATACLYLALTGGNLLMAVRRERWSVVALTVGAVVNIALNFLWIPTRGIEGAAMATAASFAVVLVLTLLFVELHFARSAAGSAQHA
ncbi:MAG: flippase [Acidobacteriota bacterium]|nr:flippase [Acidobacteriota bacterium]